MARVREHAKHPPPRHRQRQRLETARVVKDAALTLFRARGYESTTTKDIAEAAGVAHGTVFLVAPTKEGLLVCVLEEKLREATAARIASLPKRHIATQIVHVTDALFDVFALEPSLSRVLVKGIVFFADAFGRAYYEAHVLDFRTLVAGLVERARERGEISAKADANVIATSVLALYMHAVIAFLNEERPDRRALSGGFRSGLRLILNGAYTIPSRFRNPR